MQGSVVAGVVVALAFFTLIGFIVYRLGPTTRAAAIISAIAVLVAALPPIISALQGP
ncbi:hypothetical protein GCM10009678_86490 [Actinomadura kijaniata]|uniref:Putative membrane protein YqjE n=1 Tax=Actinomadura namibiensis TaxID=182080 RepID=A0A7W3QSD6_ACTNM|nr:hypothetical protein [Actinomadura namibiensis]MBA8957734.1 putative membrane protein YqjE [Actinomadura namibiensis]